MPQTAPTFESLPAPEKLKLTTYGDGVPPFPGYEYNWEATRWVPGEGIDDAYMGRVFDEPRRLPTIPRIGMVAPDVLQSIYLLHSLDYSFCHAYAHRSHAEEQAALVAEAAGKQLEVSEKALKY